MRSPNGRYLWRSWMTVDLVPCASAVKHAEPKATEHVGSVPFVVCSQHHPRSNLKPASLPQRGGWMWLVVPFDGSGSITGVGNTSKSFRELRESHLFLHHPAHPARSARMTGGAGQIGSRAMPGSVHRTCASSWLGFLHTSPHTLEEERASTEQLTALSFPSEYLSRAKKLCAFFFSSPRVLYIRRK
jgi:hypothetical protein